MGKTRKRCISGLFCVSLYRDQRLLHGAGLAGHGDSANIHCEFLLPKRSVRGHAAGDHMLFSAPESSIQTAGSKAAQTEFPRTGKRREDKGPTRFTKQKKDGEKKVN